MYVCVQLGQRRDKLSNIMDKLKEHYEKDTLAKTIDTPQKGWFLQNYKCISTMAIYNANVFLIIYSVYFFFYNKSA